MRLVCAVWHEEIVLLHLSPRARVTVSGSEYCQQSYQLKYLTFPSCITQQKQYRGYTVTGKHCVQLILCLVLPCPVRERGEKEVFPVGSKKIRATGSPTNCESILASPWLQFCWQLVTAGDDSQALSLHYKLSAPADTTRPTPSPSPPSLPPSPPWHWVAALKPTLSSEPLMLTVRGPAFSYCVVRPSKAVRQ